MKKILLPLVMLQLSASSAFAQKWSVGLNAGALWNTKPLNTFSEMSDVYVDNYRSSKISKAVSLSLNYRITSKWQVGAALDYQDLNYRSDVYSGWTGEERKDFVSHSPTYSLIGKVNRVFTVNKFQYYGGVNGGMVLNNVDEKATLRGGIQAGGNYILTRHWLLNAELGGNYFNGNKNDYRSSSKFISTTCTVGIHYSF